MNETLRALADEMATSDHCSWKDAHRWASCLYAALGLNPVTQKPQAETDATTHEREAMLVAYNSCPVGGDVIEVIWQAARAYVPPTAEAEDLEDGMTTCNCGAYGVVHEQGADDCFFLPNEAKRNA